MQTRWTRRGSRRSSTRWSPARTPTSIAKDSRRRDRSSTACSTCGTWDSRSRSACRSSAGYRATFDAQHARLYGYSNPARAAEIVNVRVKASGITSKPALPRATSATSEAPEPMTVRPAWFTSRPVDTPVFRTETLEAGAAAMGPAILAGAQATTVIPPNFRFRIDALGNVIASRVSAGGRVRKASSARLAATVSQAS